MKNEMQNISLLPPMTNEQDELLQGFINAMPCGFTSFPVLVSLDPEQDAFVEHLSTVLDVSYSDILRTLVSTAWNRYFDSISNRNVSAQEVSGDE